MSSTKKVFVQIDGYYEILADTQEEAEAEVQAAIDNRTFGKYPLNITHKQITKENSFDAILRDIHVVEGADEYREWLNKSGGHT